MFECNNISLSSKCKNTKLINDNGILEFDNISFHFSDYYPSRKLLWTFKTYSNSTLIFRNCAFVSHAEYIFDGVNTIFIDSNYHKTKNIVRNTIVTEENTIVTEADTTVSRKILNSVTNSPTIEPTIVPEQSPSPTLEPTFMPSSNPTKTQITKSACGISWCYTVEMYPVINLQTSYTLTISNIDDSIDTYFDISFKSNIYDCIEPHISFSFELIDYDQSTEYLLVYDQDNSLIARCDGGPIQCGTWSDCITNYKLPVNKIGVNKQYKINVFEPASVDDLCTAYHSFSIHANLTLTCSSTASPTSNPSMQPSINPSLPTAYPTYTTATPTNNPTKSTTMPTQAPSLQPTTKTSNPTLFPTKPSYNPTSTPTQPPTYSKSPCGTYRWCYYINLSPTIESETSYEVIISETDHNAELYFELYFTVKDHECVNPKISFVHELIDYDLTTEYLSIYGNNDALISRCTGGKSLCGSWSQCISSFPMQPIKMEKNETYKITIRQPSSVDALCPTHSLAINARLLFTCSSGTVNPTSEPTNQPTQIPSTPTNLPTVHPSLSPSDSTFTPSYSPTTMQLCGTNEWCRYVDIYPMQNQTTSFLVMITNEDDNADTYFYTYIRSNGNECIEPRISFSFEEIDFSSSTIEYLSIYDQNNMLIEKCLGNTDANCGIWLQCVHNRALAVNKFGINETYKITIFEPRGVDALCSTYHPYSINAKLTITCMAGTLSPSNFPSKYPTDHPTLTTLVPTFSPTLNPSLVTTNPTTSPTHYVVACGVNRWCYYVDMHPRIENETYLIIQNTDDNADTYFDIHFKPDTECINPFISFSFEEIDFSGSTEYLSIYDDNGVLIAECKGTSDANCGIWKTCINNHHLGISKISKNQTYKITILEPLSIDALCSGHHLYSIRVNLSIACSSGTAIPTIEPTPRPTNNPTKSTISPSNFPSIPPTIHSSNPTVAPTYLITSCSTEFGIDRWCYYIDMNDTSHSVEISHIDDNYDTYFDIYFTFDRECIQPSFSFSFEPIDNYGSWAQLKVYDNNDTLIISCPTSYDDRCNSWKQCLSRYNLGINKIEQGKSYKLSIFKSWFVSAQCTAYHDYAIHANLTFYCSEGTANPTNYPTHEPSNNPTLPTVKPTIHPSLQPSVATINPTNAPNYARVLCGMYRYCYYVDIYPKIGVKTSYEVRITNPYEYFETHFDIYFTPIGNDCAQPKISFSFELIDYTTISKNLLVHTQDNTFSRTCFGGPKQCGVWTQCFTEYDLGLNKLLKNEQFTIVISEPSTVTDACKGYHLYSINAKLIITCSADTALPTTEPTGITLFPTAYPTSQYLIQPCGTNRWCYYVDMHPIELLETSYSVTIVNSYASSKYFDIYFKANDH
eukprot:183697_1